MTDRTIEQKLADSDRMLGEALRELSYLRDTSVKRSGWLHDAKRAEGYSDNTSFDDVWANVRAERDRMKAAAAKYGNHTSDCSWRNGRTCYCGWEELERSLGQQAPGKSAE